MTSLSPNVQDASRSIIRGPVVSVVARLRVCLSVYLLDTVTSRTNTAEPIQVPFGVWTRAGPRKHVGVEINSTGRGNFGYFFWPIQQYWDCLLLSKQQQVLFSDQRSIPYMRGERIISHSGQNAENPQSVGIFNANTQNSETVILWQRDPHMWKLYCADFTQILHNDKNLQVESCWVDPGGHYASNKSKMADDKLSQPLSAPV